MRNKYGIIALLLFSFLLVGCEKYIVKEGKVYYKSWNEGRGNNETVIEGADAKTFKKLKTDSDLFLGRDKNKVYLQTLPIEQADPNTFKHIGNYFFTDKNSAYFFGSFSDINQCQIDSVNPKKIKPFSQYPWAEDGEYLIWKRQVVKLDNLKTFKPLNENWGKTDKQIIYQGDLLENVDYNTFELEGEAAKDKNGRIIVKSKFM